MIAWSQQTWVDCRINPSLRIQRTSLVQVVTFWVECRMTTVCLVPGRVPRGSTYRYVVIRIQGRKTGRWIPEKYELSSIFPLSEKFVETRNVTVTSVFRYSLQLNSILCAKMLESSSSLMSPPVIMTSRRCTENRSVEKSSWISSWLSQSVS